MIDFLLVNTKWWNKKILPKSLRPHHVIWLQYKKFHNCRAHPVCVNVNWSGRQTCLLSQNVYLLWKLLYFNYKRQQLQRLNQIIIFFLCPKLLHILCWFFNIKIIIFPQLCLKEVQIGYAVGVGSWLGRLRCTLLWRVPVSKIRIWCSEFSLSLNTKSAIDLFTSCHFYLVNISGLRNLLD